MKNCQSNRDCLQSDAVTVWVLAVGIQYLAREVPLASVDFRLHIDLWWMKLRISGSQILRHGIKCEHGVTGNPKDFIRLCGR